MGLWDGIEETEIYERGNFVKANFAGVAKIKKTLTKSTRSVGLAFIVEMEVLETNMPDHHPVGQKVTWFQKLTDKDIAFPAVAEWAAAVAGLDPTDKQAVTREVMPVLKDMMEHATANPTDNDFINQKVGLETVLVMTKNNREFTRHTWHPIAV